MKLSFLLAFLIFGWISCGFGVRVQLSNGILEGYTVKNGAHNVHVFKGVPFAEPPLGDLRFQTPKPKKPWHGVWDGTRYARPCMSNTSFTTSPQRNVSEDCLYLNVFADERCLRESCEILFYIHGGNFYYDSAIMFNDSQIIRKYASDRMIFVIPAYRGGVFGFLDLGHELKDAPYNVGFYDLILALRWVQKEGPRLGGNVKKITGMGNSGGGTALEYLISTPVLESNIFDKVIISSGMVSLGPHANLKLTQLTAEKVGCNTSENGTKLWSSEQLECLRYKPANELADATRETEEIWIEQGPQTDKVLFPADTYYDLMKKYFKATPMLITTTADEMVEKLRSRNTTQMCQSLFSPFGYKSQETADVCADFYEENDLDDISKDTFHAFAIKLAIENTERGQPSFVGIFAQTNHTKHANDLTYFFGLHPIENMTLGDKLMDAYYPKMIKHFVKTGIPEPDWRPINLKGEGYYYLNFEHNSTSNSSIIPHFVKDEIYDAERVGLWLKEFAEVEWNSTQDLNDSFKFTHRQQNFLKLPNEMVKETVEELSSNSTHPLENGKMFAITSSQVWVAFWTILSLAIILATIILVMTASRLMFTYQLNRAYTLAPAGEGTKILSRRATVPKYT